MDGHFQSWQAANFVGIPILLADLIGSALLEQGLSPSMHHAEKIKGENRLLIDKVKGIYKFDDLAILTHSQMPAVLLECGIIVNRNEEKLLKDVFFQNRIVSAVVQAVGQYVAESGSGSAPQEVGRPNRKRIPRQSSSENRDNEMIYISV